MVIVVIIFISLLLFKNSFSVYFFQDDWFLLSISKVRSLGDFLHFFIPRSDVQFYRPLSGEIFYFLGKVLFGLNPFGFHLITWIFFVLNVCLIWKLSRKFINSKLLQLFLVFLYATSAIHNNSLFWLANFSYIFSGFWYFLGFLVFLKKDLSRINPWLVIVYILGLLSNEFMLTFPLMLVIYGLLFAQKQIKKNISTVVILVVITLLYLAIRLFIFKPDYGSYKFVFDKSILSSYRWFFLFFLNWPETMKDQMISWYRVSSRFLETFTREFYLFMLNLGVVTTVVVLLPFIYAMKNKKYLLFIRSSGRKIFFALFWYIINLLPIIFIPSHISPHQGTIAIFGFMLLLIISLESFQKSVPDNLFRLIIIVFGISWIVSSIFSIELNDRVHWIKRRSELARYWITKTKNVFPTLPKRTFIQIPTEDKEVIVALRDGWGIQNVYSDDDLSVIFSTASATMKEIRVVR